MNRTQIFALTVAIVVAASFSIAWYVRQGKLPGATKEAAKESDFVMDEKVMDYFKEAEYVTVEKVERTCIDYEDGNFDTNYDTYLVSDLDLKQGIENTQEYSASLASAEMDDSKIENTSFLEQFGFEFETKKAWDIFADIIGSNGIDQSLSEVDFDKDTYELTKQKLYVLRGKCKILDEMLEGVEEEDVTEAKVYYQTVESAEGVEVPEGITAYVQYKKGTSYVTKTMYIELIVNHWTDGEE